MGDRENSDDFEGEKSGVSITGIQSRVDDVERFEQMLEMATSLELSGQLSEATRWCDALFSLADDVVARGRVYALKARLHELKGQWRESLDTVKDGLHLFGVDLPSEPDDIERELKDYTRRIMDTLSRYSIDWLVALPEVSSDRYKTIMLLLFRLVPSAVQLNPPLFILADLMLFDLTAKHGTSRVSSKNFVDCGIILGSNLQQYATGYEMGLAAFRLLDKYPEDNLSCGVNFVFAVYISHWREYFPTSLEYFDRAILAGLETGDLSHTSYSFIHQVLCKLFTGSPLSECADDLKRTIQFLKNANTQNQNRIWDIAGRCICEFRAENLALSECQRIDEDDFIAAIEASKNTADVAVLGEMNAWISYHKGNYLQSHQWTLRVLPYVYALEGMFLTVDFYLIAFLSIVQILGAVEGANSSLNDEKMLRGLLFDAKLKLKLWADLSPDNFAHKYHFAMAEQLGLENAPAESIKSAYDSALGAIKEGAFIHQKAAILEHRAFYLLKIGEIEGAQDDFSNAAFLYETWGAFAKTEQLRKEGANTYIGAHH